MKMNRETIEREAKELQEKAMVVQAGLQTMKNLKRILLLLLRVVFVEQRQNCLKTLH